MKAFSVRSRRAVVRATAVQSNRQPATLRRRAGTLASAALLFASSWASADPCGPYISNMFYRVADQTATLFAVQAVRMTARGTSGFSSFSMHSSYTAAMGISTSPAPRHVFHVARDSATGNLSGRFQDVFPGRTTGASDLTTLSFLPAGAVQLRFDAWGGSVVSLSSLECFSGMSGSAFLMTGRHASAGFGLDAWTLLVTPVTSSLF